MAVNLLLNTNYFTSNTGSLLLNDTIQATNISSGTLIVNGGGAISKDLYVGGTIYAPNVVFQNIDYITATNDSTSTSTGSLQVAGGVGIAKNTFIGGNLTVLGTIIGTTLTTTNNSTSTSTGSIVVIGGLGVEKDTHLNNTYIDSTVSSALTIVGGMTVNGIQNTSTETISGTLNVNDVVTCLNTANSFNSANGSLIVSGGIGVNKDIQVGGNIYCNTLYGQIDIAKNTSNSTSTNSGSLLVAGGVGIAKNIYVGGNINTSSSVVANSGSITNDFSIGGNSTISGSIVITGGSNINSTTNSTSTSTGSLIVTGGCGIGEDVFIGGSLTVIGGITSGIESFTSISVTSNNDATSSSTGALQVVGGIGIGGKVYMSNNTGSNSTSTGALQVQGGVGIGGNLSIGGFTNNSIQNIVASGTTQATATPITNQFVFITGGSAINGILLPSPPIGTTIQINNYQSANSIVIYPNVGGSIDGLATNTPFSIPAMETIAYCYSAVNVWISVIDSVTGGTGISISHIAGGSLIVTNTLPFQPTNILSLTNTSGSTSSSTGALIVAGGVGIAKDVYIGGELDIGLGFHAPNAAGSIYALSLTSGTQSTSTSTGSLVVTGGTGISGNMYVGGISTVNNATASTSSNTGSLQVIGGVGVGGDVYIGGELDLGLGFHAPNAAGSIYALTVLSGSQSTSSSTGSLVVTGGTGISGNMYVGGELDIGLGFHAPNAAGSIYALTVLSGSQSTSSSSGSLVVTGGAGISGNMYVGGELDITAGFHAPNAAGSIYALSLLSGSQSTSTSTGSLVVSGGTGISGNMYVGGISTLGLTTGLSVSAAGLLKVNNTTASGGSNAGALQVIGGVGIGGDINIGGVVNSFSGTSTFYAITSQTTLGISGVTTLSNTSNSGSTLNGALTVAGGAGISKNVSIGGIATIFNTTQSSSTSTGALLVNGGVGINGNLSVGGVINGTIFSSSTQNVTWSYQGGSIGTTLNVIKNTVSGLIFISQPLINFTPTSNSTTILASCSIPSSLTAATQRLIPVSIYQNGSYSFGTLSVNTTFNTFVINTSSSYSTTSTNLSFDISYNLNS